MIDRLLGKLSSIREGKGEGSGAMSAIRALALINVMLKAGMPYHRALSDSRAIAEGGQRKLIDRILCGALMGKYGSLEQAIDAETDSLPKELLWFGRTLREYTLAGSEGGRASREEMLDRAFSSALDSCRQSLREAASGLRVPVSMIFALGIVLPIILATMIPLWGSAYTDGVSSGYAGAWSEIQAPEGPEMSMAVLSIPTLLFPVICLLASSRILGKGDLASECNMRSATGIMVFLVAMGVSTFVAIFLIGVDIEPFIFLLIAAPVAMLAGSCLLTAGDIGPAKDRYERPSMLNAISARLSSGEHFVRALIAASDDREEKRRAFWDAMAGGNDDGEALGFKTIGLIARTARSDSCLAADMLRQVARHLNDLGAIRDETRFELRPIAQSVLVATVLLSPFVLGIAAGFDSIGSLAGGAGHHSIENLFVVFSAEMALVGLWLIKRLSLGDGLLGRITARPYVAIGLSAAMFALSLSFSRGIF